MYVQTLALPLSLSTLSSSLSSLQQPSSSTLQQSAYIEAGFRDKTATTGSSQHAETGNKQRTRQVWKYFVTRHSVLAFRQPSSFEVTLCLASWRFPDLSPYFTSALSSSDTRAYRRRKAQSRNKFCARRSSTTALVPPIKVKPRYRRQLAILGTACLTAYY